MAGSRSNLIGITMTPNSAELVEAKRGAAGLQILRRSTLPFAPDAGLDNPSALGESLQAHMKDNGYSSRRVAFGLCSRWLLTRSKQTPPADPDALSGIVNLQIERDFAGSMADMSFDYLQGSSADSDGQLPLLVVGAKQSVLDALQEIARIAGLTVELVTGTPFACSQSSAGSLVSLEDGVASVIRSEAGMVTRLAPCHIDPSLLDQKEVRDRFLSDLSRCMLQIPSADETTGLTLLLPSSMRKTAISLLAEEASQRFGEVNIDEADPTELLVKYATKDRDRIINFNDSRLAPPKKRQFSPAVQWSIRAAVLALLIGGTIAFLWYDAAANRANLQAQLDAIQDKAENLDTVLGHTRLAEGWYDKRPPVMDVMLALTRTFPKEGEIRVETLTVRDTLLCEIECTAENRETMDAYFNQMQLAPALTEVNRGGVRPAGGQSDWIDFPIAFRFDPTARGAQP